MNFALLFFITLVTVVVAQENVSQPTREEIKIRFNVDGCDDDGYFPLCGTGTIWKNVSSSVKNCEIDTNTCPKALAAYEAAGYPKSSNTYWQDAAAAAASASYAASNADAAAASYANITADAEVVAADAMWVAGMAVTAAIASNADASTAQIAWGESNKRKNAAALAASAAKYASAAYAAASDAAAYAASAANDAAAAASASYAASNADAAAASYDAAEAANDAALATFVNLYC